MGRRIAWAIVVGTLVVVVARASVARPQRYAREELSTRRSSRPSTRRWLGKLFNQATAAMDANRLKEARAGFEKILARVPENAPTLRRLSYVLGATPVSAGVDAPAWGLFPDRAGVEGQMTGVVNEGLNQSDLID